MPKPNIATIQITKTGGQFSYTFWEDAGERFLTASRLEEVENLIGMKGLRLICADQLCEMLNGDWDGRWESLEEGAAYIVRLQLPLPDEGLSVAFYEFTRNSREPYKKIMAIPLLPKHKRNVRTPRIAFPRLWELFGFALRKKTRERIFKPAQQDLLVQYLKAQQFTRKWERRWLTFCFTLRTIGLILSCWQVATWAAAIGIGLRFIPPGVKEWVLSLFR